MECPPLPNKGFKHNSEIEMGHKLERQIEARDRKLRPNFITLRRGNMSNYLLQDSLQVNRALVLGAARANGSPEICVNLMNSKIANRIGRGNA